MQIYRNLDEWQRIRRTLPSDVSLGFVPTMGHLHAGHMSLFTTSQRENDRTVASIFINPTQFNQPDDFQKYPRTLESDLELLEKQNVHDCILPSESMMYADGYRYRVEETKHTQILEGTYRPGHFTGVLTVVMKLLQLVQPTRSYFGEKDYQQYQLIKEMTSAFFMPIEIKVCPTIREESGLAYSSRNTRLSSEQRILADAFVKIFHQPISCEDVIHALIQIGIKVDYIEEYEGRRYGAVYIGTVRLIDNFCLK